MRLQGAIFDVPDTLLDREGRPLTGLMPFLSLLRMEGVLLYLVSEEERRTLQPKLEAAGLAAYFRGVLYTGEQGRRIEDPELYEKCVRRLGTARPATLVFTAREKVLRCVREAGFQVVLVGKEHPEELRALADEVVDSYEDMTKKMC